jgi:hypothetical protein
MTSVIGRLAASWISGVAAFAALPASAEEMAAPLSSGGIVPVVPALVLPGTEYAVELGKLHIGPTWSHSQQDLLKAIAAWLTFEFDLPAIQNPPTIAFASARRMIRLRVRDVPSDRWAGYPADVLAVYDDEARTIYLPEGWIGNTAAELSVLVHEMVHHMQNSAGKKFECPEAREKQAYQAQEKWLGLFGSDLTGDFEIDPFTLLVRTTCFY